MEYDRDFVYFFLECCVCSLDDLIKIYLNVLMMKVLGSSGFIEVVNEIKLVFLEGGVVEGNNLWKVGGYLFFFMLKLMRLVLVLGFMYIL